MILQGLNENGEVNLNSKDLVKKIHERVRQMQIDPNSEKIVSVVKIQ